jgi:hypothetical protein
MIAIAHDAATNETPQANVVHAVSLARIYVLRATYLLLVIGLGALIVPDVLSHPVISRGVIPSLLGAVWVLAFVGLKFPLEMLPLLMFEFAWKSIWMVAYGLPQWSAGQLPPTFAEDSFNIGFGVILMPLVIPWGYVYRHYVKQPGAHWR